MVSTVSTAVPTTRSVTFPPSLPACSKNASLSPRLSRCSLHHDEPSTSIHCTVISITTLLQRKHIRWGYRRTVNSTVTVTVCTRCWEWYWNYFAAWSCVTVVIPRTPQAFQDIKLFLSYFWNSHMEPFLCGTVLLGSEIEGYEKNLNLLCKNTKFWFVVNLCLLQMRGSLGSKANIVPRIK